MNYIKQVILTLPFDYKIKNKFIKRVNKSKGNLERIKYNIGVLISKKSIPLNNKKVLISKLDPD